MVKFGPDTCRPCPVRDPCTTAKRGARQLTIRPRAVQEALDNARVEQDTKNWQAKYALRAGVEGTIHQGVAVTDLRHASYRGLPKTHLEHVYSAVAITADEQDGPVRWADPDELLTDAAEAGARVISLHSRQLLTGPEHRPKPVSIYDQLLKRSRGNPA